MILHCYSRNHCLTAKCSLHLLTDYLPAELYICSVKLLPPLVTSSLKEGGIGGMHIRLVQYHNPDKMGPYKSARERLESAPIRKLAVCVEAGCGLLAEEISQRGIFYANRSWLMT